MNLARMVPAAPVALAPSSQGRELLPELGRPGSGSFLGAHSFCPLAISRAMRLSICATALVAQV